MASHIRCYRWEGITQSGEQSRGIIDAENIALAKTMLRKKGIITRKIVKKRPSLLTIYHGYQYSQRIKSSDITLLIRQMATLTQAGIPLLSSIDILAKGNAHQRIKTLIESIKKDLNTGLMLSQALSKHPTLFNALCCSMIDVGEQSGSLDLRLDNVATHKEKMASIKKKVNKALAYPLAVTLIAIVVTCGLLTWVIPQFESLFAGFGAELPALTRYVIKLSGFFKTWWAMIVGLIAAVVYVLVYTHKRSATFSMMTHRISLNIPIMGKIIQKTAIARFTRTLSITFSAGIPLNEALQSVAGATGNRLYAQAAYKLREEISHGQSMQCAMQQTQLFPFMVIQFISIGEESGTLDQMLIKIADFYEEDVNNAVDALSSLLEPLIMTILGLLIGGLVVAMYLPILTLGSVV